MAIFRFFVNRMTVIGFESHCSRLSVYAIKLNHKVPRSFKHRILTLFYQIFTGYLTGSEDYYTHMRGYNKTHKYLDLRHESGPVTTANGKYSTHLFTQKAIDAINGHTKKKVAFLDNYVLESSKYITHFVLYLV